MRIRFDFFLAIPNPRLPLLLLLLSLGLGGCMSSMPMQSEIQEQQLVERLAKVESAPVDDRRIEVIGTALAQIGTPYAWGGAKPETGFDCSGLVKYTLNLVGIETPRTAAEQFTRAQHKSVDELLPGDLLFFHINPRTEHVAIYLGAGEFIHAPSSGSNVRLESLHQRYWLKRFSGVGSYL